MTGRRGRARGPSAGAFGGRRFGAGALVSVSAATGLVCGLRGIARAELPGVTSLLGLEGLPREALGVRWTETTLWPADLQALALERLVTILVALVLATGFVATLNALVLLTEAAAERRADLAVRGALGATRGRLARMLIGEVRALVGGGLVLGVIAGALAGGAMRSMWPALLVDIAWADTGDAALGMLVVALGLTAAYAAAAVGALSPARTARILRAGTRTSADPVAVFLRKVLAAGHTAIAGAAVVGALTLATGVGRVDQGSGTPTDTLVGTVTASAEVDWSDILATLAAVPGIEAESLAAPGALLGLGVRSIATAECGACSRGLMPAPLWPALADHHAVAPGYFDLTGLELLDGRAFTPADDAGAAPVAIVSETFARLAFERGRPVGKRVLVGSELDGWHTVVGVVADAPVASLGTDDVPRAAVYLSALQHRPRSATVLLRGSDGADIRAEAALEAAGLALGPFRTLARHRMEAAAPLRWARRVVVAVALIALALAAFGVWVVAVQTARRREPELALRRALGAGAGRTVGYVLGERLRVSAWGVAGFVFLGTLTVGLLQRVGGMPGVHPATFGGVSILLVAVSAAASLHSVRLALDVEPATLLD